MSTSYYYLKPPISSIRLVEGPGHDKLSIWENGALAGDLVLSSGAGRTVAYFLADTATYDGNCPVRTFFGGAEVGCEVRENVRGLDPELVLVSEYGEPIKVSEIREMAGVGRRAEAP